LAKRTHLTGRALSDTSPSKSDSRTKPDAKFRQIREAVYERMFGEALEVSHELIPQIPHIDVYFSAGRREAEPFIRWLPEE
jgi:hypothetical protein